MARIRRIALIALSLIVLTSLASVVPAGAAGPDPLMAAKLERYNPWGYEHGQPLTEAQASTVALHRINLEREEVGQPAVSQGPSTASTDCAVNTIHQTLEFKHHYNCIPNGQTLENLFISAAGGDTYSYLTDFANGWFTSTGHHMTMLADDVESVSLSMRCVHPSPAFQTGSGNTTGYPNGTVVIAALHVTGANGQPPTPKLFSGATALSFRDREFASTGIRCADGEWEFSLALELQPYLSGYLNRTLSANEPAPAPSSPQLWHRFQIARLYDGYFGRNPDTGGWSYWNRRHLQEGMTLWRMSEFFADSVEFKEMYGPDLSNEAFIALVYQNVMDRLPDAGGLAYWANRMDNQGLSRGELMVFFSESPEYIRKVAPQLTGLCWAGDVAAAYDCAAPFTFR